jgi:hypothetical protein
LGIVGHLNSANWAYTSPGNYTFSPDYSNCFVEVNVTTNRALPIARRSRPGPGSAYDLQSQADLWTPYYEAGQAGTVIISSDEKDPFPLSPRAIIKQLQDRVAALEEVGDDSKTPFSVVSVNLAPSTHGRDARLMKSSK